MDPIARAGYENEFVRAGICKDMRRGCLTPRFGGGGLHAIHQSPPRLIGNGNVVAFLHLMEMLKYAAGSERVIDVAGEDRIAYSARLAARRIPRHSLKRGRRAHGTVLLDAHLINGGIDA